ncbi:hypothetical protein DRQ36_10430 [bacterium]|nr:MAG: hypothetical protein DRQ36_10430 [bacterium]
MFEPIRCGRCRQIPSTTFAKNRGFLDCFSFLSVVRGISFERTLFFFTCYSINGKFGLDIYGIWDLIYRTFNRYVVLSLSRLSGFGQTQ